MSVALTNVSHDAKSDEHGAMSASLIGRLGQALSVPSTASVSMSLAGSLLRAHYLIDIRSRLSPQVSQDRKGARSDRPTHAARPRRCGDRVRRRCGGFGRT